MKTNKLILNLIAFLTIIGLVAGCSSTGYEKAADTATSLTKSSEGIVKSSALVDKTLATLDDLVSNPKPDLRKQFSAFNDSVHDLGSTAKDVDGKSKAMKSQGADYFKNWDKQMAAMKNEDIRNRSEARKVRLLKKEELPADWNPNTDSRLTIWEATHHLIRSLDSGEQAAAALLKMLGAVAEIARDLSYRLYTVCERRKWSQDAIDYNALVLAWPDLKRLADEQKTSGPAQQELI